MRTQIKKSCCLLILLLISMIGFSQRQFHVTIQFVPKLDTNNLQIVAEVGKGVQNIPVVMKKGKIEITLKVYTKFAYINITSTSNSNQKSYFITKETSSIVFSPKDKTDKDYPFVNGKLTNAIDIFESDEFKKFHSYVQKEQDGLDYFKNQYGDAIKTNPILTKLYQQLGKNYDTKCMVLIQQNNSEYFYFWLFYSDLQYSQNTDVSTLLDFYEKDLYPKFKDLYEANTTMEYLKKGRTVN
jgi:hypothetical protein